MTPVEPIMEAAMIWIRNEPSLDFDRAHRLPLFYRRMWGYMQAALPLFSRPPEMLVTLRRLTPPRFGSKTLVVPSSGVLQGLTGFQLCSAVQIKTDELGDPYAIPLEVSSYNPSTGILTVTEALQTGDRLELDFHSSGSFTDDLDPEACQILAFCIYDVWEHRFANNFLERTAKLRDSTFSTVSEASMTQANTARVLEADRRLSDLLRTYADNLEYLKYCSP